MSDSATTRILGAIANKKLHQADIAKMYADCLVRGMGNDAVDYPRINRAIIERWSRSGLMEIKRLAWRRPTHRMWRW